MDVSTVDVGGATLAYSARGEGPTIVFVPNWATNMEALDTIVEPKAWFDAIAAAARLVMFDQRGTGLSDRGAVDHRMELWLDDLEGILDAAGVGSATLFGQ